MKSMGGRDTTRFDVRNFDEKDAPLNDPRSETRQDRQRILHVLERVINGHNLEGAKRK